jgi:hypothetical protein
MGDSKLGRGVKRWGERGVKGGVGVGVGRVGLGSADPPLPRSVVDYMVDFRAALPMANVHSTMHHLQHYLKKTIKHNVVYFSKKSPKKASKYNRKMHFKKSHYGIPKPSKSFQVIWKNHAKKAFLSFLFSF